MSHKEAFAPVEAINREIVYRDTWGHLAPEPGRKYPGWIMVDHDCYGGYTILEWEFEGLYASPWQADDFTDFMDKIFGLIDINGNLPVGVYRYEGWYKKFKNGNYQFQKKPFVQQTIVGFDLMDLHALLAYIMDSEEHYCNDVGEQDCVLCQAQRIAEGTNDS